MLGYVQEKLLYRILSGRTILKINDSRLDVLTPSLDLLYEASEIYEEFVTSKNLISKEDLKIALISRKLIDTKHLEFLDQSHKLIETWQKDLFLNWDDTGKADSIRSYIEVTRKEQERILSLLCKYDNYTKEGLANYAKSIFLIKNTTYKAGKKYKFNNSIKPIMVLGKMSEVAISPVMIRKISKNPQWSNLWFGFKGNNIFDGANSSLEQQLLLMWSRIYDGVRESTNCPKEEIVLDDDAIDGWLLLEKQKRQEEKKERFMETKSKFSSKLDKADEVFVMAKTKEEIDRINSMNSAYSKAVKDSRMKQIQSKGIINHHDLSDVKQEIMMQRARMENENVRGK